MHCTNASGLLAPLTVAWALQLMGASAPTAARPEDLPVQVFLLVGQSNMQGKGKLDHLRQLATDPETAKTYGHWLQPDGSWTVRDDVWIWTMGKTGALTVGYASPEDRFGPELQIGHMLGEAIDAPVLLIKIAWGGKSLAVDFRPPSAGGEVGPFYTEVLKHTREVLADLETVTPQLAGREHELQGIIWFQGWNDRVNQEHNDAYEGNLAHLIRDLRMDLKVPELPFVIGETGQGGVDETHPRALSLMKAQATVALYEEFLGNVVFVRTRRFYDAEPRHDGGYHFFGNAANFFRIGDALGRGMLDLRQSAARLRIARGDILAIDSALTHYARLNARKYPASLLSLVTPDANGNTFLNRTEMPRDPWGNEYVYDPPTYYENHKILSYGADGRASGEGAAADVTLFEAQAWLTAAPQTAQDGFHYEPATFLDLHEERSAGVTLGDVDGDGDLDIVIANGRHWPGQNRIFVNNGRGEFTLSRDLGTDRATSYAAPMADVDGDGDLDIAVGNDDAPSRVFWNDGLGRFRAGPTIGTPANTRSLELADLDGDGAIDVIVANRRQQNSIFFGDDSHRFERHERFGASDGSTIVVAVGDLDEDGHIDLVEANRDGQPNFLYLNDGQGHFDTPIAYGTASDQTVAVALGDLDGDGHLDVLNANSEQSNAIYFGDGAGHFDRSLSFGPPGDLSYALAVLDLDGDGDLDVVVANRGQRNGIYLNSGAGSSFREIRFGEPQALTYGVAAADLDGDGVPEIVTANSDGRNWLYRRVPGPE